MRIDCHVVPIEADLERNAVVEPEGERLRKELVEWIAKNGIVSLVLDTPEHCVTIDIVKLPPNIKSVLTIWGSIYVKDEPGIKSNSYPWPESPETTPPQPGKETAGEN